MDILSTKRLRPKESTNDEKRAKGALEFDYRTPTESDFGRVIFSPASRRLHDKTQVFPLTTDDNIHSRLTHSMEVMSLGRSFALFLSKSEEFCGRIGKNIDDLSLLRDLDAVLSTVCLTHDIGNPPFGHFGETTIQQYFVGLFSGMRDDLENVKEGRTCQSLLMRHLITDLGEEQIKNEVDSFLSNSLLLRDYTEFDGNAQGFRVLTKLQFLNDLYGMNLTSASLASYLKYPNCGAKEKEETKNIALHKHGVFTTEYDRMSEAMDNCGITKLGDSSYHRHPLSFFMEAADSICYLCMDIEDGFSKGWLKFEDIKNAIDASMNEAWRDILKKASSHFKNGDSEIYKVIQLRTEIIAYFQRLACQNFTSNIDDIFKGTYWKELIKDDKNKIADQLGDFCVSRIFTNREIESLEITGNAVIKGIMDTYIDLLFNPKKDYRSRGRNMISKSVVKAVLQEHYYRIKEDKNSSDYFDTFDVKELSIEERLRMIRDFVAGMTDGFALGHYQKVSGQKI